MHLIKKQFEELKIGDFFKFDSNDFIGLIIPYNEKPFARFDCLVLNRAYESEDFYIAGQIYPLHKMDADFSVIKA